MSVMRRITVGIFLLMLVGGYSPSVLAAPQIQEWTPDARVPGYLDDTFTPFLVADQNRTVHAFASQWVYDQYRRKAVVYRQWSLKGGWTKPVDILLMPTGDAEVIGVFLDPNGVMHVIFMSGEARNAAVYYSKAPAYHADQALAWSPPLMIGEGIFEIGSAAISGDEKGNLIVIYSGNVDGNGIYVVYSKDGGETWTLPEPLFFTPSASLVPFSLRLFRGPQGQIRAAWNVVTSLGEDESLYFASYDPAEEQWSKPIELDNRIDIPGYFGPSFPAIVDNGRNIIIMYNGGNPFSDRPVDLGRPIQRVRISANGGATWNEPMDPFPFHVGRSGEHALVLDGSGNAHALFVQRIESTNEEGEYSIIGGIWHSVFQNGAWTNPTRLVTTYAPHDVRAVVSQGNVLLVVWREDPGAGQHGVWYSYTLLDVQELPIVPLPTAQLITPFAQQALETPLAIPTPTLLFETDSLEKGGPPPGLITNPAASLFAGILPALLVITAVVLAVLFYRRNMN